MADSDERAASRVSFHTFAAPQRSVSLPSITNDGGEISVPYLTWGREADLGEGPPTALILDDRLMYVIPDDTTADQIDALVEFIANAIAIGAGYASIYYTKRKMPFRG